MNELIVRAAKDRTRGAAEIAADVARALAELGGRREILRAASLLLRAHPAMAPLWRMLADALEHGAGPTSGRWAGRLEAEAEGVTRAAGWVVGRRSVVLTHSASSSVEGALTRFRSRVRSVICTESRPGEEGSRLARRLARNGFEASWVPDAGMLEAAARADLVLAGADAVTEDGVVNKLGTALLALAAREAGTPLYVLAGSAKLLPGIAWAPDRAPLYDRTPLGLVDAVVGERGALGAAAIRRAVRRIEIPPELLEIVG